MITFTDFMTRLAQGQLKNTAAVDDKLMGFICPEYEPMVLNLTNQGLTDLSTRFPLVTRQVDLIFEEGQNTYPLVWSDLGGHYLDTDQTGDAFSEEDFVKVLDIWDQYGGRHPHDTNGHIMTPTYNTLRFTTLKMSDLGEKVRIRYQAKYPTIEADGVIDVPPNLVSALQLFVASLFISHMNGQDHSAKGDSYFAAYLRHIGEDEARNNSSTSEVDSDTRFQDRGFV